MSAGIHAHPSRELVVWRFTDGKPGHDNQSRGLIAALARRRPVQEHAVQPLGRGRGLWHTVLGRYPGAATLPDPDLIVGAGHRTHWSMLAARRARGGRTVVLMGPTLPLSWFDLCIIPAHDRPPARSNVLVTRGVLNAVQPGGAKDAEAGLILVGGPSRHYDWDESELLEQIRTVTSDRSVHWQIATSRRTPDSTESALQALHGPGVTVVPWRDTTPQWLPAQLARAAVVWVSADSVSMVYEALTAGAACGLLEVPARGASRVRAGVQSLLADGLVIDYPQWRRGTPLRASIEPFDEAGRCADWIEQQWLHAS